MLEANDGSATIHPPLLRPAEMAELLAALFEREADVVALVCSLARRNAGPILAELRLLAGGALAHDGISHALRWILPEIHHELGREFRAVLV